MPQAIAKKDTGVKVRPVEKMSDIVDVVGHVAHVVEEQEATIIGLEDMAANLTARAAGLRKDNALALAELESALVFLDPQ